MKLFLLPICIAASLLSIGQNLAPHPKLLPQLQPLDSFKKLNILPTYKQPSPGVHYLPQDQMPFLVPDTKELVSIPNGWREKLIIPFRGIIPNPSLPLHPSLPFPKSFKYKKFMLPQKFNLPSHQP